MLNDACRAFGLTGLQCHQLAKGSSWCLPGGSQRACSETTCVCLAWCRVQADGKTIPFLTPRLQRQGGVQKETLHSVLLACLPDPLWCGFLNFRGCGPFRQLLWFHTSYGALRGLEYDSSLPSERLGSPKLPPGGALRTGGEWLGHTSGFQMVSSPSLPLPRP